MLGVGIALVAVAIATGSCARSVGELPLRRVEDVPLTGGTSRFDYTSLYGSRLYIAHLGSDEVVVVDVGTGEVVATIEGLPGVHGVLVVPELGRIFATATDANELVALDDETGAVLGRVKTGQFPDGLAYEPTTNRVFISAKLGGSVTVVDAESLQRIGQVELGGEVGNVRLDPASGRVLANAQSAGELVAIDPQSLEVVARTRLDGCEANHGLLVDAERRLAFVACEDNATLVVVDLATGRQSGRFEVGDAPDVLAFDPGLHRLYVAAESGVVTVLDEVEGTLRLLARGKLADSAHTVAVDPATSLVYFPLEDVDGEPVLRVMEPTG